MAVYASEGFQPEPVLGFDHEKSVQSIGFFLRASGKPMDKMKLVKLIYLADRLSLQRRGKPLNFDDYYSMTHGPVVSCALNGMNGQLKDKAWNKIALAGDKKTVTQIGEVQADHLSRADLAVLQEIWDAFGDYTAGQLRKWTHDNCGEYIEVEASRLSIDIDEIFDALGVPDAEAKARELKQIQRSIGGLTRACGS